MKKQTKNNKGLQDGILAFCVALLVILIYIIGSFTYNYIKEHKFINEAKELYNVVKKAKVTTSYVDSLSNKIDYDTSLDYFFILKNDDVIYMLVYNNKYIIELDYEGRIIPEALIAHPEAISQDEYENIISYKHRKLSEEKDKINSLIDVEISVKENTIVDPNAVKINENLSYQINKYICKTSDNKSYTQYESNGEYIVNLALGTFSHSGYSITISRILIDENGVTILINEKYPDVFNGSYSSVVTSPCTMVAFSKKPSSVQVMKESTYNLKNNTERLSYEISEPYQCSIKVGGYIPRVEGDKFIITVSSGSVNNFDIIGAKVTEKNNSTVIYVKEELKKNSSNTKLTNKKYNNITQKYSSSTLYDIKNNATCVDVKLNKIPSEFFVVTEGSSSELLR